MTIVLWTGNLDAPFLADKEGSVFITECVVSAITFNKRYITDLVVHLPPPVTVGV